MVRMHAVFFCDEPADRALFYIMLFIAGVFLLIETEELCHDGARTCVHAAGSGRDTSWDRTTSLSFVELLVQELLARSLIRVVGFPQARKLNANRERPFRDA